MPFRPHQNGLHFQVNKLEDRSVASKNTRKLLAEMVTKFLNTQRVSKEIDKNF